MCVCVCTPGMCMEIREQLSRARSQLPLWIPGTELTCQACKHLYSPSHLTGSSAAFNNWKIIFTLYDFRLFLFPNKVTLLIALDLHSVPVITLRTNSHTNLDLPECMIFHLFSGNQPCFKGLWELFSFKNSSLALYLACCTLLKCHINVESIKTQSLQNRRGLFTRAAHVITSPSYNHPWVSGLCTKLPYLVGMCSLIPLVISQNARSVDIHQPPTLRWKSSGSVWLHQLPFRKWVRIPFSLQGTCWLLPGLLK